MEERVLDRVLTFIVGVNRSPNHVHHARAAGKEGGVQQALGSWGWEWALTAVWSLTLSTLRAVSESCMLKARLGSLPYSLARRSACRLSGSPTGPGVDHFGGMISPSAGSPSASGRGDEGIDAITC